MLEIKIVCVSEGGDVRSFENTIYDMDNAIPDKQKVDEAMIRTQNAFRKIYGQADTIMTTVATSLQEGDVS